jgi:hypothetical protein
MEVMSFGQGNKFATSALILTTLTTKDHGKGELGCLIFLEVIK